MTDQPKPGTRGWLAMLEPSLPVPASLHGRAGCYCDQNTICGPCQGAENQRERDITQRSIGYRKGLETALENVEAQVGMSHNVCGTLRRLLAAVED